MMLFFVWKEFILRPWHLIVLFLASQLNREQQHIIEYLQVENQVLREKLGKGRILLNDDQPCRLAVKGKALGRRLLRDLASIVTPDTLLRWHRELVAQKWDFSALVVLARKKRLPSLSYKWPKRIQHGDITGFRAL